MRNFTFIFILLLSSCNSYISEIYISSFPIHEEVKTAEIKFSNAILNNDSEVYFYDLSGNEYTPIELAVIDDNTIFISTKNIKFIEHLLDRNIKIEIESNGKPEQFFINNDTIIRSGLSL